MSLTKLVSAMEQSENLTHGKLAMVNYTQNLPAAKFASQGDVNMRTDAQIKFLYYFLHSATYLLFLL